MSDTAAGGGVAGAGQDEGADNEPPRQALLLGTDSSEVGEMSEEGAPPSAKRTKVTEEDQEQEPFAETVEMCGETPEEPGTCLHEDISSLEQSMYNCSNKIRDAGSWLLDEVKSLVFVCTGTEQQCGTEARRDVVSVAEGNEESCENGDGFGTLSQDGQLKTEDKHGNDGSSDIPAEGQQ